MCQTRSTSRSQPPASAFQFWDGADQTGNGVVNGGTGAWNASNTNWTGAPGQATINDQWRSSVGVFAGAAGTVTVAGAQAFDTLQFSTTGYVLNAGAGGQLQLSGLSGTGTINTDSGVVATINAPIVDGSSQSLAKVGGGTLILTAANTYSGGTTISGGTLQLGNGGATGSIIGNVTDNGVFAINRSDAFTFGGVISGTGAFNQIGTGSTTLTAIETYSGLTTISAGTLALTGAGSIANSSGVVANSVFDISGVAGAGTSIKSLAGSGSVALGTKTLTLTNASDNFAGSIGGSGGFTLTAGTQTLSGNNAYTGATTITGGTLALAGAGGIASSSGVVDNATFDISGTNSGTSIKTLSGSGSVALGTKTLTLTNASDNFAGAIGGSGGFTLAAGTQTLSAVNGYTGATTITAGTLALAGAGSIANSSGVAVNGTFDISGVSGAGTSIQTLSGSGSVALGTKTLNLTNASGNFAGAIGGSGGFTLAAGTQTLSGVNSYTGLTTITAGALALSGAGNISSSSGVVANGAFDISGVSGASTSIKSLSGSGSVALGTKTLTLTNASGNFAGSIGGSGGFTLAAGTQTLSAVNGYTGATTVTAGTLALAGAGSIANSSGVAVNGTVDISGVSGAGTSIQTLSGSGSVALGTKTLNLTNAFGVFSGSIAGTGGLTLAFGHETLSGVNSYTGVTTINVATLSLSGAGNIASSSGVMTNGGFDISGVSGTGTSIQTLSGTGSVALGANTLTLTNASGNFTGSIAGTGGLTITGGTETLSGGSTFTGLTTISGGTLILTTSANLPGSVTNGATFSNAGVVGGSLTNTGGTSTNSGTVNGGATISGGMLNTTGAISGGLTNAAIVNAAGVVNGPIANAGTFATTGTLFSNSTFTNAAGATLAVNAATYTLQGLLANSGAVTVANGATLNATTGGITNNASGTITVAVGGTVKDDLNNAGVTTNNGAYIANIATNTGAGSITNTATGSWTGNVLSNAATITNSGIWTGNVVSNAGTINNNLTWTGTVSNAGTFNNNTGATVSGLLTNTGGTSTNSGTVNGGATISGGTLNTTGAISGGLTNAAIVNAAGVVNGPIANAGTFATTGTLFSNSTFTNAAGAILAVNAATYTLQGLLANSGAVTVANGATLNATTGGITNNASGTITVAVGGTVKDDLNNAGVTTNNGAYIANIATNTGAGSITNTATGSWTGNVLSNAATITNSGIWTGNVVSNAGTINNNLTWTGTVSNAGTFNNNTGATVSGLLTNTGGTSTNSGTVNGGATISGGMLNTTGAISGGLTNAAIVNAAGVVNGPIANAGTFATTGTLFSNSTFTNAAGAILAVNAATYTLQGLLANSGAVTVANGATLNATTGGITNNASGTITVAVGGTVKDDLNNAGVTTNNGAYIANIATNTGAGSITNTATGSWTGNVLSNAATITNSGIWTGNVVSNAGTINNNLTWTGTVSNAGTFNNNAGATVSGLLTNTAGTTVNNGALNGGANVSGGTFAGSGTVTNLAVSGGTFAPGNGTPGAFMTVTGNLAFQSGAMYLVTLDPTTASFASVGGTASLNGTAAAVYLAGNYISKKYTILSAAGGVSGTFGSLLNTNVPANFTSSLSYDANNAYVNLVLNFVPNPAPNFGSGLNVNQQNVANTLVNFFNTTGGIPLVFGTLTPAGLTQASGELGTGVIQSSIKANDMFLNLLLDPSVAGRAGGFASGSAPSQFAADDETLAYAAKRKASPSERDAYAMATKAPYLAPQPVNRWSVWGAAYGGSATTDGNTIVGSHDTTARAYGVVGGADYKVTPDALVGFALAGGGTSFSIASALGSGNSDLFQAGAFGRQNIGAAYLSAALAYGWQDVTTNRTVTVAGADVLRANFKAETFSARFEGGYRFATPLAGITPYVAAQAISFNLPAYAEQGLAGAGTFALNYGAQTTTATRTELGLRTDKSFAVQNGIFTLRGRAAWAHDYNNDRAVTAVFQTLPGAAFVVNGARANPDGALVSAGAEMKWLNGFSLAATFEGEFSGNVTSYAGKGVARYTW